ncbi:MAG: hypothetical protein AB1507_00310 [Bacillota bacterium]|jgi:hypothetical protein
MRRPFVSRRWVYLFVVALLLAAGIYTTFANRPLKAVDPQKLIQQALARTKAAKSYSYRLQCRLVTAQGTRCLSNLSGRRILPDRVHVKGKIFNSAVEIIQVDGVTYVKDIFSPKWLAFEGDRLGETGVFVAELDPLVLLDFAEVPTVALARQGRERGKKRLYLLECKPRVKNRFLASHFTDFAYRLSVEPEDYHIVQVEVQARGRNAPTRLMLGLELADFDRVQKIAAPPNVAER